MNLEMVNVPVHTMNESVNQANTSETSPLMPKEGLGDTRSAQSNLSDLMLDWFDPKEPYYDLGSKLNEETFKKLYEIGDCDVYANVCLRIVYQFFYECDKVIDLQNDCFIQEVFKLQNKSFKLEVMKVIVAHWDADFSLNGHADYKQLILDNVDESEREFFEIAFLLLADRESQFECALDNFLEKQKQSYGDYFQHSVVPTLRLLLVILNRKCMRRAIHFVLSRCPFIDSDSTILSTFQEIQKFVKSSGVLEKYVPPLTNDEFKVLLLNFKKLSKSLTEFIKSNLFDFKIKTNDKYEPNGFERILATPGTGELINLVFNVFELWQKGFILNQRNPSGKFLIDYVIESGDHTNLHTFLMPNYPKETTLEKRKNFLMLLNRQFTRANEGKTLYQHYLETEIMDFSIIFNLLEESRSFKEILDDEFVGFKKLKDRALSGEFPVHNTSTPDISNLFRVDYLVGNIIAYCTKEDKDYRLIKEELKRVGIVYEMLFLIIERREEDFISNFTNFKLNISEFYQNRYKNLKKSSDYTSNYMLMYLIAAMKQNQRKVIDLILSNENFESVVFKLPENIDTGSIYNHVALKLLQNGHVIGENQIPSSWITPKVMNDFLNSQVVYRGHNLIEINSGFMLRSITKQLKVKTENDIDDMPIFWGETESLKFMIDNENIKSSITHPVVANYIDLKTFKYYRIYNWNFIMFLLLYVLPFSGLIWNHFTSNGEVQVLSNLKANNATSNETLTTFEATEATTPSGYFFRCFCFISLFLVIIRERFQFVYIEDKNLKNYFLKKINVLEVFMIVLSFVLLMMFTFFESSHNALAFLSALFLLVLTVEVLCLIPISSSQQYTMIIKNVAKSSYKFFFLFGMMLVPFSFCFRIIFRNHTGGDFFPNFQEFWTSLFKLSLVLAGEYSIDLVKLKPIEMIFVSFFVLTTFWLYALLVGFAVRDIKDLKDNARQNILEENARKIIKMGHFFYSIYEKYNPPGPVDPIPKWQRKFVKICKFFITKYTFTHKIEKVFVNIKTREITVRIFDRHINVLEKKFTGEVRERSKVRQLYKFIKETVSGKKYLMDETNFKLVRQIVNTNFDEAEKLKKD